MDGQRFDGLARAMAGGAPRRGALRLLAGAALAGVLGAAGAGDAAAGCFQKGRRCRYDRQCCSGRCREGECARPRRYGGGGFCAGVPFAPGNFTQCGTTGNINYPCFCAQNACVADTRLDSVQPCPQAGCPEGQICVPGVFPGGAGGCFRQCPNPDASG